MKMDDRERMEAKLAELKSDLLSVEGTQTEVYSRIVGYYRSVRNWNAGKREEFGNRVEYAFPTAGSNAGTMPAARSAAAVQAADSYMLFTREACPNCPSVRGYLEKLDLPGTIFDIDTEEGLDMARRYEVLSTPTAILLDSMGDELARANTRARLQELLAVPEGIPVTA
jgi:ribonucleoside-triphosphate reductase